MGILDALEAIIKLGLPMMGASWIAFKWLQDSGEITSDANSRDFEFRVKKTKKLSKTTGNKHARFLFNKWARFGSGFYGLAGFWTFIVIEVTDLMNFFLENGFSNFARDGLINLIVDLLINQLSTFITALLWFSYWPGPSESILLWVIVAFLGYRVGIELARGRLKFPKLAG